MAGQSSTLAKLRRVRLASAASASYPFTGLLTIDGIATAVGDLVLMKDQASYQNGLWVVTADTWRRSFEMGSEADLVSGTMFMPSEGSQAGTVFYLKTPDPIVWGTTETTWGTMGGPGGSGTVTQVNTTAPVQGGPITTTGTVSVDVMKASGGASPRTGLVPDPGSVAGSAKYLREDATWQVPPTGGAGTFGTATMSFAGQRAVTTVADAGVALGSHLQAWLQSEDGPPVGNPFHAYEAEVLRSYIGLSCGNIVAGVSFDVVGVSQVTLLGDFTFHWQRG